MSRLGCVPVGGPAWTGPFAGQGRAVGSWRSALPWCYWGRGGWPWEAEMGSCAVGRVEDPSGAGGDSQGQQSRWGTQAGLSPHAMSPALRSAAISPLLLPGIPLFMFPRTVFALAHNTKGAAG